jgi:hypothetical protein
LKIAFGAGNLPRPYDEFRGGAYGRPGLFGGPGEYQRNAHPPPNPLNV